MNGQNTSTAQTPPHLTVQGLERRMWEEIEESKANIQINSKEMV